MKIYRKIGKYIERQESLRKKESIYRKILKFWTGMEVFIERWEGTYMAMEVYRKVGKFMEKGQCIYRKIQKFMTGMEVYIERWEGKYKTREVYRKVQHGSLKKGEQVYCTLGKNKKCNERNLFIGNC